MDKPSSNKEWSDDYSDMLTPEQRFDILADILSTIALRIVKERHEQDQTH
jgi:hypothetical protein